MGNGVECSSLQLIDGNGTFNLTGLDNFIKQVQLAQCGVSYAVVSIIGPQSSGKSTLLNHLFGSNFKEMNADDGRSKTTKGIWLANCVCIEPPTLVMDVEGSDGRERGQDDTAFEKQSALFALAVSDIVLLNMWCHEIGREQAANKPLLRTVFQVMMTLFSDSPRKVTLMFVIRDKSKTPLEKLERDLKKDIEMIWDSVPKPQACNQTPLSEFFNVKVVAFSNYERDEELFKKEVDSLRQQFFHSITPGGLAGDRRHVIPASEFSSSAQDIWGIIKENKYLNLPKHRVMVATVRCKEISKEKFAWFSQNKDWCKVENDVQNGVVSGFGMKLNSLINTCLSEYDEETKFYDEGKRSENRKKLEKKLLPLVQSAHTSMMKHIRSTTLLEFKESFAQALREGKEPPVVSSMAQFDSRCADADIRLADLGTFNKRIRDEHQNEIHEMAARTSKFLKEAKWARIAIKRIIIGAATIVTVAAAGLAAGLAAGGVSVPVGLISSIGGASGGASAGLAIAAAVGEKMKKSATEEAINEIIQGSGFQQKKKKRQGSGWPYDIKQKIY